jgi:hypothetical protein
MKVIEEWSPCFPDVFLLEKGRPFGYIKERSKKGKDGAQHRNSDFCRARKETKFAAGSRRQRFLTGDRSLIRPNLFFQRKENKA